MIVSRVEKDAQEVSVLLLHVILLLHLFLNLGGDFTGVRLWFVNTCELDLFLYISDISFYSDYKSFSCSVRVNQESKTQEGFFFLRHGT